LPGKSRGWSIRHRLVLVAAGVALPLVLLSAGIIWQLAANERTNRRDAIVYATRTLMNAVDGLLRKQIAVAEILASSPALQSDDLATFRMEAERAMQGLSGAWVVVSDADGNVLLNLIQDPATTPQQRGPAGLELQRRALQSNQPQISDVIVGPVTNTPVVAVEVPVRREGRPPLALTIAMDVRIFLPMFEAWNLPEGWLAGLIDGKGNFIARSRDHERTVGTPAAESFRDAARGSREGWTEFDSVDGIPIANAHVTSRVGNWVMAVAADQTLFEAPIRRTLTIAILAGIVATLASVLLALLAARRIANPIEQIETGTHALLLRHAVSFAPTGVPEVDRALDAFAATAKVLQRHEQERDEREQHIRLIMRELSHRSKNLLAIVMAIARQTARNSPSFQEFERRFNSRIQALAAAHDLLVEQQWGGATLEGLASAQLSAFGLEKISMRGPPVRLRAEAIQNVALALHELGTNASKYGSLSVPEGRVEIDWALVPGESGPPSLRLTWRETGGPKVAPPEERGFGCFVLERVTVNALGEGKIEFHPDGLIWTCTIGPEHLIDDTGSPGQAPHSLADERAKRRAS
jgi:two-component sensor histidine kinase